MNGLINACGGRRFLMCIGNAAVCTVLVWHSKITPEVFGAIIIATVAAYITGNTAQKIKGPQP